VLVILIGQPAARARLRARLPPDFEIAAEATTAAAARSLGVAADAWVVAIDRDHSHDDGGDVREALTAREQEVLVLMAEGLSNQRIGGRLGISDQTVKFHVAAICGKLGAANRTGAVRIGIERGLVPI
jgi:DNA-binding NarL/FixJ family response regulator